MSQARAEGIAVIMSWTRKPGVRESYVPGPDLGATPRGYFVRDVCSN